jgi:hypothetical protein
MCIWIGKCNVALNNKLEAYKNFEKAIFLDSGFTQAKEALLQLNKK